MLVFFLCLLVCRFMRELVLEREGGGGGQRQTDKQIERETRRYRDVE